MSRMDMAGRSIGHIRITRLIGAGGMGEVYLGFDETLRRRVAVKTIGAEARLDPATKARFLREARVLSRLDHPRICKIHDYVGGDSTDYLVLEYIDGRSLRDAIRTGLDRSLKLKIAQQVAEALVAAHGKGVIHRDIKTANVMLMSSGDVKVLDFGLARLGTSDTVAERVEAGAPASGWTPAKAPPDPEAPTCTITEDPESPSGCTPCGGVDQESIRTVRGTVMGTPRYMSPEQARGEEVTAASDMYSFGLLLRELFTGQPPGVRADQDDDGPGAGGLGVDRDGLTGELRTLVERLESPSPGARPSASETLERLRWIRAAPRRRNRRLLVAAAVVIALLAGVKYTIDLRRERGQAIAARDQAEELVDFMVDLFEVSDPGEARGRTVTAREVLRRGADEVSSTLGSQPATQAKLMETIGVVYTKLGLYDDAAPLLERSLELRRMEAGPSETLDLADSFQALADLYNRSGRFARGEELVRRSIAVREQQLGPEHPDVGESWLTLGQLCENQRRYGDAERAFRHALEVLEASSGPDDPRVAESLRGLGIALHMQQRYDEAEPCYRRALAIQEASLGRDHPDVGATCNGLAALCEVQGRLSEAESLYRRSLDIRVRTLGPDHPDVAYCLVNIAGLELARSRFVEAEAGYRRALEIQERSLGADHLEVGGTLLRLSRLLVYVGETAEAEATLRRAIAVFGAEVSPSLQLATAEADLANLLDNTGRFAEAERLIRDALEIRQRQLPANDPSLAEACFGLAHMFHRHSGRTDEAEALYRRAIGIWDRTVEPDNWHLVFARNELVGFLNEQGRRPEAAAVEAKIPPELRTASSPLDH